MIDWTYNARNDLAARINRRLTQWRMAAPVITQIERPIVSFTFDDFPKSALNGADIVERHGGKASFYACTSMAGKTGPYGEMFDADTLADLNSRGHEIGSHTHTHLDCSISSPDEVLSNIDLNLQSLREMGHDSDVTSFAYPFGETRLDVKARIAERFAVGRGVFPGVNHGRMDRSHLKSYTLDPSQASLDSALAGMNSLKEDCGWIILFSHDVSDKPSDYGVTPQAIETLCQRAVDLGAVIAPMTQAAILAGAWSK